MPNNRAPQEVPEELNKKTMTVIARIVAFAKDQFFGMDDCVRLMVEDVRANGILAKNKQGQVKLVLGANWFSLLGKTTRSQHETALRENEFSGLVKVKGSKVHRMRADLQAKTAKDEAQKFWDDLIRKVKESLGTQWVRPGASIDEEPAVNLEVAPKDESLGDKKKRLRKLRAKKISDLKTPIKMALKEGHTELEKNLILDDMLEIGQWGPTEASDPEKQGIPLTVDLFLLLEAITVVVQDTNSRELIKKLHAVLDEFVAGRKVSNKN